MSSLENAIDDIEIALAELKDLTTSKCTSCYLSSYYEELRKEAQKALKIVLRELYRRENSK